MTASAPVKLKITPETVRTAYIEKGLKPRRYHFNLAVDDETGRFINDPREMPGQCCAIGALLFGESCPMMYRDRISYPSTGFDFDAVLDAMTDLSWVWFYRGFDASYYNLSGLDEDQRRAYELGRMCWAAVADLVDPNQELLP